MEEVSKVVMIERVCVAKFDHTLEDKPTEPIDVVIQETRTEVSQLDAMLMGWVPKDAQDSALVNQGLPFEPTVEVTGTVQLGVGDGGGHVGD